MATSELGRLESVDLRSIWSSESADFTPWLARKENLEILAEALGIEIEYEAHERKVGPFRADILCKEIGVDRWVLIENQLERTDHGHLGQLLTYASGLDAVTIVWIAAKFTEEHRSTLDWLNRITDESFRFFGLEVELWRIGASPAAPKFNIVSMPNNWTQSVAQAAHVIDDAELSEIRSLQRSYWELFQGQLRRLAGAVAGNKKPQAQSWMDYPIGRVGFHLSAVMIRPKRQIRAELYIAGEQAKSNLGLLLLQKEAVEGELGYPLEWEELPSRRDSRVASYLHDVDPDDEADWQRQHEWLAKRLNDLHRVFASRVAKLGLEEAA
ncbi:DUF4268 domain-containing protein [Rhodopseudomonas sp. HC1]|uniref:DUF4268 domain-containing protein n=1 Tax=Rhodopseudomonas infernalis TaxID=2897386 RepID=UPI001EE89CE2|nr:DUF4268 domain-containing protein [Rhodopseudomonas infernalis]MCG6205771.1 DUF4268 domain-containing protein [Rhodopseudomonas infernalis]